MKRRTGWSSKKQAVEAMDICPLCAGQEISLYFKDRIRDYLHCSDCELVFVPGRYHLNRDEEKVIYDLHRNCPDDKGYLKFLSRLAEPLLERLTPGEAGLDFGCGPGPALSVILEENGYKLSLYDPFYFDNPSVLNKTFDFITATEVVEHLSNPGLELTNLFSMIKKRGFLGMMTKMVIDRKAFSRWHYIQDRTHICFYSRKTFKYLSEVHDANLEFIGSDVIIMQKR